MLAKPMSISPMKIHMWIAPSAIQALLALFWALSAPAQAPRGWTATDPGFSAEVLLSHDGAIWAAGSEESIAVSTDGGQHWQKKHQDNAGALLLSFAFVTDTFGYAAGTGGRVLFTRDGGESWTAEKAAPETVLQAAFADRDHGLFRTQSELLATTDGGKSWKPVEPANDPNWSTKYPFIDSMTALDSNHLVVRVSEGEASDGEFLWTDDGGATWNANYLPNGAGDGGVFIAGGQYWSVGSEVVDKDKPGGGHSIPMAVQSKDGIIWDHRPVYYDACHWHGCGGCTAQGCFAGENSFVPLSRILQEAPGNGSTSVPSDGTAKPESLSRFSTHLLSDQWAKSGDAFCILTAGVIECSTLLPAAALDTKDEPFDFDKSSWPPMHSTQAEALTVSIQSALPQGVRCIRCDLSRTYFSDTGDSGPTPFGLAFVIGTSGRAENIKVSGKVPEDVAARMRQLANSWLFEPHIENGVSISMAVHLSGKIFVMNFSKPPR